MLSNKDSDKEKIIEKEKDEEMTFKTENEFYFVELEEKYNKLMKNSSQNDYIKEKNCLNKLLESSFALNKFDKYNNKDFLDDCEYKLVFMPDEFNMKEDNKYYFNGFSEKKKKKINYKNRIVNKNIPITEVKKNKKKFD